MNQSTLQHVQQLITDMTGQAASISGSRSVGGGCINNAQLVTLNDGREFFVKSNSIELAAMFECEAAGLAAMQQANTIRIPNVIGFGSSQKESFLVLESIKASHSRGDFFEQLGRGLAQMHKTLTSDAFGFKSDNFLGSSLQPNEFNSNWVEFWTEHRLGFQLRMAADNRIGGRELQSLGASLINRLQSMIGQSSESPVLIHGDLWSGNFISDEQGNPVLIDPAVYFANREAEFGMTTLFGGFDRRFYDAYEEVWPLLPGSTERIEIYRLYHLLNHLNLFGSGYLAGCLEILRKYK